MSFRQDIQILRGIAVLLVVLYHLQVPGFANGFLGVDIFFVISGYLMATLYDQGTTWTFYRRRLDRLLPAYAVTIMVTLLISSLITVPVDHVQLADQSLASAGFLGNMHFWTQNSYFERLAFNPLLNLWSLGVEVQFYLVVPLLYPVIRHRPVLLWVVLLGSLVACLMVQRISPTTAFFLMPFRVWEFVLGAWVAWQAASYAPATRPSRTVTLIIGLMIITLFYLPLRPDSRASLYGHPALAALAVTILTALALHIGTFKQLANFAVGRLLSRLGDYSYSIYLVHFPAIVLWNYKSFGGTVLDAASVSTFIAIALTILALGWLSYQLLERKLTSHCKTPIRRIGLLVSLLLFIPLTQALNESRFTAQDLRIFAGWTDRGTHRCGKIFRLLNPKAIVCRIGERAEGPRIMLVGNSHADAIKTSFTRVANESGYVVLFVVENKVLIGGNINSERLIKEAERLGVKHIFLHYSNLFDRENQEKELKKFMVLATSRGNKVTLLGPTPYYDKIIPKEMLERSDRKIERILTRAQHEQKITAYQELAKNMVQLGIEAYSTSEWLCPMPEKTCLYAQQDGTPYYYDTNHLTLTGAKLLEPLFKRVIH